MQNIRIVDNIATLYHVPDSSLWWFGYILNVTSGLTHERK
ncbi:hypothetical protein VRK_03800 [Vibrio sp. MEBiC08052]|nr:hypothetical protein VRK_03800 [Vibrio sp. MEBiC08052]